MLLTCTLIAIACLALILPLLMPIYPQRHRRFRRAIQPPPTTHTWSQRKPQWVGPKVTHLKVLMPNAGCRQIADTFNRLYASKQVTIGKTFVAKWIKSHAVAILRARASMKNRPGRQGPRGLTLATDITFHQQQPVLGVIDHSGTRALLALVHLRNRTTIGILRVLLDVFEKYGTPRFLRTDNEAVFTSRLMAGALALLRVHHQRSDPFCPWQNGRIERLFGTLRRTIEAWFLRAGVPDDLGPDLDTFRDWYNHARPHRSLAGLTPAMAWAGITSAKGRQRYFRAWDGILAGFVVPT